MNQIPLNYSTFYEIYPNKSKYSKIYGARISFNNCYTDYETTHQLLNEWFAHHKRCFNGVWLQPEYYPTHTPQKYGQIHYHGYIDLRDLRAFNRDFLKKIKGIFECRYFVIKDPKSYWAYINKEIGITECINRNNIMARSEATRAL